MTAVPACFKAYDIRGRVPTELDAELAYRIGLATANHVGGKQFAVGRDCRLTSGELCAARRYAWRPPCLMRASRPRCVAGKKTCTASTGRWNRSSGP